MAIAALYPSTRPSLNLDFANTKTLDPRITFTRASTATCYDGKKIAKAEENLLVYSQTFGVWAGSASTVTDNAEVAPDATMTAAHVVPTSTLSRHYKYSSPVTSAVANNLTITGSIYVKAGAYNYCFVQLTNNSVGGGSRITRSINLTTGAVGGFTADSNVVNQGVVVTSAGNGWFRVALTMTSTVTGSGGANVIISPMPTDGTTYTNGGDFLPSFATDGVSGAYFWGAQLEIRSAAAGYIPTTSQPITNYIPVLQTAAANTPRFDHNPTTGESLGLLIEEQRTNLLLRSQEFDDANWQKANSVVISNQVVAPDGTLSADLVTIGANDVNSYILQAKSLTYLAGASYTISVYIKSAIRVLIFGGATPAGTDTYSAVDVGNGWYRQSVTRVFTNAGSGATVQHLLTPLQGMGTTPFAVWGAQLEAGSFPTSYIPTTTAQVTRAADAAYLPTAGWCRFDEGTLFADFIQNLPTTSMNTDASYFGAYQSASLINGQDMGWTLYASNIFLTRNPTNTAPTLVAINGVTKIALAVDSLGKYGVKNGGTVQTVLGAFNFSGNPAYFALSGANGTRHNHHFKRLAFYPRRLSNSVIQALTT
jgi:hypothetical protein